MREQFVIFRCEGGHTYTAIWALDTAAENAEARAKQELATQGRLCILVKTIVS